MIEISPSLLAADFGRLKEAIELVEKAGADSIHLDVMDGHFVPNISYGPPVITSIRRYSTLPFWAHLMISEPRKYINDYVGSGVDGITIHLEVDDDAAELAAAIRDSGVKPGLAINPDTPVNGLEETLRLFDKLLFMTVYPGFGGQSFMPGPLDKIRYISSLPDMPIIEVDGGVDITTAPEITLAGTRSLVAGSAIFRADDPAAALRAIRQAAEEAVKE